MSPDGPQSPATPGEPGVRVLAFCCSRYRPLMVRHAIMQMQRQSYPVHLALYMNSSEDDGADHTIIRYGALLEDARAPDRGRVTIGYGPSRPYHGNYVACLGLINVDDYDLFLKIDDDDIYYRHYAEHVVADFVANRWDYSGTHSDGVINGRRWHPNYKRTDLGFDFVDLELRAPIVMPPTLALSRKAIKSILSITDSGEIEDIQWRRFVASQPDLVKATRSDSNFVYNVHGGNASTGGALRK